MGSGADPVTHSEVESQMKWIRPVIYVLSVSSLAPPDPNSFAPSTFMDVHGQHLANSTNIHRQARVNEKCTNHSPKPLAAPHAECFMTVCMIEFRPRKAMTDAKFSPSLVGTLPSKTEKWYNRKPNFLGLSYEWTYHTDVWVGLGCYLTCKLLTYCLSASVSACLWYWVMNPGPQHWATSPDLLKFFF